MAASPARSTSRSTHRSTRTRRRRHAHRHPARPRRVSPPGSSSARCRSELHHSRHPWHNAGGSFNAHKSSSRARGSRHEARMKGSGFMQFPISRPMARFTTTVALAGTLGLSGGAAVMAQEASPAAGPDPSTCVAPAGTAAPVAAPADGAAATPGLAAEMPEGTVVEDEAVIAEATAAIENLYACYNLGDGVSYVSLYTDTGILANWGEVDRATLAEDIAAISAVAPAHSIDVHEVQDLGDGSYAVDYQVHLGKQVWHV